MSRKNVLLPHEIIPAGTDLAEEIISEPTNIQYQDNIGLEVAFDSLDAVGLLQVQVSLSYQRDTNGRVLNEGKWTTIASQAIAAAEPETTVFDLNQLSAPWIRLLWSYTSGTGEMVATITGKML